MYKQLLLVMAVTPLFCLHTETAAGQLNNPGNVAKQDASNHANNDMNNSINNGLNKVDNSIKGLFKKKKKNAADTVATGTATGNTTGSSGTAGVGTGNTGAAGAGAMGAGAMGAGATGTGAIGISQASSAGGGTQVAGTAQTSLTSYQNYDFVPGNTILFEDAFTEDQTGEFPSHWDLTRGQAMLGMQGDYKAFFLTDGNYCMILPLMKNKSYLTDNFSIEYDLYGNNSYCPIIQMNTADGRSNLDVHVNSASAEWKGYNGAIDKSQNLRADLPADIASNNFTGKWHHIAIGYKNDQMKVYVDKYRVLTIPHCAGLKPAYIVIEGIGDHHAPIIFKDFKVADGVQMYMVGQKFTDAKIVTHGINFDVDKSTIKPESMGTLNMIVKVMQDNPELKFEVDGHTDNSGTAAHNLTLSQQRSEAVKAQLIAMGVDASRLSSKGFGDTRPMSDNATLDGKANNRRVEFVRQ